VAQCHTVAMPVLPLQHIRMSDRSNVGGKAASLGELLAAKHPVPPAFVITADEQRLTSKLTTEVLQHFDELALTHVAVRSSGIGEDGHHQSWAGQFATLLHVTRSGLPTAIQTCWDSAATPRATAYAGGKTFNLAVVVQHMVYSDTAGVAFSVNPITGNKQEVIIEAVYGLGEQLVQGLATPDNYITNKTNGKLHTQDIATKQTMLAYASGKVTEITVDPTMQTKAALMPKQLAEITALVTAIETYYGFPVDIEWAYENGKLYLLQARPITTI